MLPNIIRVQVVGLSALFVLPGWLLAQEPPYRVKHIDGVEKIRLLPSPALGEHNSFPCQVEQVVYTGTETRFRVRLPGAVSVTVRQQNVLSTPDPTGFYADSDTPAYAVWLNDAGRVLVN